MGRKRTVTVLVHVVLFHHALISEMVPTYGTGVLDCLQLTSYKIFHLTPTAPY